MAIIQDALSADPLKDAASANAAAAAPAPPPAPTPAPVPAAAAPMAPLASTPAATPPATQPAPASPSGVAQLQAPQAWNVTPAQTVEGRIASIISSNNPIIQQARDRALQTANSRGILNSSMAIQASDNAAYAAATPIATADAATAAKAASYNADETNQYGIKNQEALNTRGNTELTSNTQRLIAGLQSQTQLQVQQMQADNSKLLQTNNQAATAFNQALVSMNAVNMNDKMDAGAKTQAIAQIQSSLQTQLRVLQATSALNLTSQLNFSGYDGFDGNGNYIGFPGGAAGAPGTPGAVNPFAPQQGGGDATGAAGGANGGASGPTSGDSGIGAGVSI